MKKGFIAVLTTACVALAMPHKTDVQAASKCVVPKDWGRLAAATTGPDVIVFESQDGTLRAVHLASCKTPIKPYWEVSRE